MQYAHAGNQGFAFNQTLLCSLATSLPLELQSMEYISSGLARLATEVVGSGTPTVFLHANVCDKRMWRAQLNGMGARHKAVAYDRRGFGETRAEPEDFSALADLVAVLEATADGKPAVLVGCSLGGRIALDAAIRHPSRVRALILIAPMS
ncbi:alpha/beta fold hydrolase [Bradyrhizobium sp. CCBAU 11361]|uniref:alpha/beta fold hydrolase n=1 Tax=Bradyrhizobium sp. CCBAU 11361 TaxID=1630812 RepID=UPI0023045693|nr:alpha/beta hydrolase [Bradyrhizobium sp. CCBAU 11361]